MRIRNLILLALVGSSLLIAVGFTLLFYQIWSRSLTADIDRELFTAAMMAKAVLPADYHDRIAGNDPISQAEYLQMVDRFNLLCQQTGLEYLWSLMLLDGKIVFTSATSPSRDISQNDQAGFLEAHSNPGAYDEVFRTMQPAFENITDKWGDLRAVLVPFNDSQGRKYLVGASRRTADIAAEKMDLWRSSLLLGGSVLALGILASLLLANALTRPIDRLMVSVAGVAAGDYREKNVFYPRDYSVFELASLALSFELMKQAVRTRDAALRRSEEGYRLLTESIKDVVWILDAETLRFRYVSPSVEKLRGYTPEEVLAQSMTQALAPEAGQALTRLIHSRSDMVRSGQLSPDTFFVDDVEQPCKDGSSVWTEVITSFYLNLENDRVEVLGVTRDISERRRAEAALRESELKFRSIAEHTSSLVAISDAHGVLTYASPSAQALFLYSPEEMCGRHFMEFLDPASIPVAVAAFRQSMVCGEGAKELELLMKRKDGSTFVGELNAAHFRLGEQENSLVMIQDITARKRAETVLRENEERLRRISTLISDIAYSCKVDEYGGYSITWMMGAAERVTGYSVEEIIARGCWGYLVLDEDRRIFDEHVIGLASGAQGSCELRICHKSGAVVWLASFTERVSTPGVPQAQVLFGALVDISERKQAEECILSDQVELQRLLSEADRSRLALLSLVEDQKDAEDKIRRLNVELENRVAERTAELSHANTTLLQALRVKDEFLANMSHELRTPLTGILGLAEVLQAGIYGEHNEKTMKALHNIDESGKHLLSLINDILDLSKAEARMLELDLQPLLVMNVVQSSLRMVRQPAQKKHISIAMGLDSNVELLVADERRLKQILVNLLSNAVKFTGEGGAVGVDVTGTQDCQYMDFTVWDTGIGIAAKDVERLFKPFVQLDASLERQYEGTGLGLSLVAKLVELHGGSIRVESQPNVGSRFTVSLPWRQPESATARLEAAQVQGAPLPSVVPVLAAAPQDSRQPLCLVAEDNEVTLGLLCDYLVTCGCRVIEARNGAEAVLRAQEVQPQVILMDIQMPVMDGLKAIRLLRQEERFFNVPIIALTALAMAGDRERCLEAGADDYLSKPVDFDELRAMLDRLGGRNRVP